MRSRQTPNLRPRTSSRPFGGIGRSGAGRGKRLARSHVFSLFNRGGVFAFQLFFVLTAAGETANAVSPPPTPLPDVGLSLLRVLGALAIVLAVFLGGVWLIRNWQRLTLRRGRLPRLNVLEVRSLGGRHVLYVVGYEQERFLLAASPGGVHLVSHLQTAEAESPEPAVAPQPSFPLALTRLLRGKSALFGQAGELK
jgi:flagellar biogenesis protein FliO